MFSKFVGAEIENLASRGPSYWWEEHTVKVWWGSDENWRTFGVSLILWKALILPCVKSQVS